MRLVINVNDEYYSKALAGALSLRLQNCDIVLGSSSFDYEIKDQLFMSLDEICTQIDTAFPGSIKSTWAYHENCRFTCFLSGNGGSGVTTTALVYARRLSRLEGKKVLFVPVVPLSNYREIDEFGVYYYKVLNDAIPFELESSKLLLDLDTESHKWDEVVIDLSFGYSGFSKIVAACERAVVLFSPWGRIDETAVLLNRLRASFSPDQIVDFHPAKDEFSFSEGTFDISGELGLEVAELAKKLE